jgi:hypothetical protein
MGYGMGASLASGSGTFQIRRERAQKSAAVHTVRVDSGAYSASSRWASFNDWIPVVCFLALVGAVVLGGLLMLFSLVTTTLPARAGTECLLPECVAPAPVETLFGDDARAYEPQLTP